jgi:hypothetical protein
MKTVNALKLSHYEIYQSPGSSRWNLRKVNRNGTTRFIRGYRTREEAEAAKAGKETQYKRALV